MESPTFALMSFGTNVRAPSPTLTGIVVAACARAAEAAARRVVEKNIMRLEIFKRVLLEEICKVLLEEGTEGDINIKV